MSTTTPSIAVHTQAPPPPVVVPPQPIVVHMPETGGTDGMDLAIATLNLLGALAWPLTVAFIVWLFHKPLLSKLGEVTHIELPWVKLQIENVKRKAQTTLEPIKGSADITDTLDSKATSTSAATAPLHPNEQPDNATHGTSSTSPGPATARLTHDAAVLDAPMKDQFKALAEIDPRSAILFQWRAIEELLARLAYVAQMDRAHDMGRIIMAADARNLLSNEVIAVLRDLRAIRNNVAHSAPGVSGFSAADAHGYRAAALPVLKALDEAIESVLSTPSP